MSKDIKDYLHYYLGCDVRTNDHDMGDGNKHYGRVGTFIGFVDHTRLSCRLAHRAGPEGRVSVFMLKPILRPLSDMTEEEQQEMLRLHRFAESKLLPWFHDTYFECIHYLLSKHFDLFGLIESGLAIDKTTIKNYGPPGKKEC